MNRTDYIVIPYQNTEFRYVLEKKGKNPLIVIGRNPTTGYNPGTEYSPLNNKAILNLEFRASQGGYDGFILLNLCPWKSNNQDPFSLKIDSIHQKQNLIEILRVFERYPGSEVQLVFGQKILRNSLRESLLKIVESGKQYKIRYQIKEKKADGKKDNLQNAYFRKINIKEIYERFNYKFDYYFCYIGQNPINALLPLYSSELRPRKIVIIANNRSMIKAKKLYEILDEAKCIIETISENRDFKSELHRIISKYYYESSAVNLEDIPDYLKGYIENICEDLKLTRIKVNPFEGKLQFDKGEDISFKSGMILYTYFHLNGVEVLDYEPDNEDNEDYEGEEGDVKYTGKPGKNVSLESSIPVKYLFGMNFSGFEYDVDLYKSLINDTEKLSRSIGAINNRAKMAEKTKSLTVSVNPHKLPNNTEELLEKYTKAKILKVGRNSNTFEIESITFASEHARFFACGGWLEDYVYNIVQKLIITKVIQDYWRNMKIKFHYREKPNEIDVAFLAHNQLYIIECKTGKFNYDGLEKGLKTLRKLNYIRKGSGLNAKTMYVSYLKIDESHNSEMFYLAKELGIEIVSAENLKSLESCIKEWISKP